MEERVQWRLVRVSPKTQKSFGLHALGKGIKRWMANDLNAAERNLMRSNAVARSSFFTTFDHDHHHDDVGKRMKSSSSNGRVLEAATFSQYCKSKGHQFYDYFFHSNSKNTTSENKRVVPTGPNPLHNSCSTCQPSLNSKLLFTSHVDFSSASLGRIPLNKAQKCGDIRSYPSKQGTAVAGTAVGYGGAHGAVGKVKVWV
ncbi:unnamed protein product [Prunus armeniaca]